MAQQKSKAENYINEANKALNRFTIFGFGKNSKYEDAAEYFKQAGNHFKLANELELAANAYINSSNNYKLIDGYNIEIIQTLIEAGNCYKKNNDIINTITIFKEVIESYNNNGRFGMAAKYAKEIAELYEADNNVNDAIQAYQEAYDLYIHDNKSSNANQCSVKIGELSIKNNDVLKAATIYEDLGKESMKNRLGQYSAKGHFFMALLCYLASNDTVQVTNKLSQFKDIDFSFSTSRECEFIEKILKAIEDYNSDDYAQACSDYDKISPLDPSKTSLLLKAKKNIIDQAGGDGEVDLS